MMTNTAVRAGDTVYLLPGTYDQGVMTRDAEDNMLGHRVVIPSGVTLKATGTAEETIITGAPSPSPFGSKTSISYGLGTNAVRCAYVSSDAVLDGVTLTGGRTVGGDTGATSHSNNIGFGGGCSGPGLVKNCIITNNYAYNGAGGACATFVKCRVLDNKASYRAGALYRAGTVYGCVIAGNNCDAYTVMYPSSVYNCTFGNNNSKTSVYFYQPPEGAYKVFNTIIDKVDSNNRKGIYWHCAINTNTVELSEEKLNYEGEAGSIGVAGSEAMMLDDDLSPLPGSPVIDIGDNNKQSTRADGFDIGGGQRIYNGTVDAGAYEYDWRPDFGKLLGPGVTITEMTSNTTAVSGEVVLPAGAFELEWNRRGVPQRVFTAEVTGEGTLTVKTNGVEFATLNSDSGAVTYDMKNLDNDIPMSLVFEGEGNAKLSGFRGNGGSVLIFR